MAFFSSDKDNAGKGIEGLRPENLFKEAEKKEPGIVEKYTKAVSQAVQDNADRAANSGK